VIGMVPYLLGFHPTESVVALFMAHNRVVMTGRWDLPPVRGLPDLVGHFTALRAQHEASDLVVVVYSRRARGRRLGESLVGALAHLGLKEVLLVADQRWWSLTCDQGCCPAEGTAFDPTTLAVSAEAVLAGMTAVTDRGQLADQIRGPGPGDLPALEAGLRSVRAAVGRLSRRRRQRVALDLIQRALDDPATLDDEVCLQVAVLVTDIIVRDVLWVSMSHERAQDQVTVWHRVVSRIPPSVAVGPVCLLGVAAWIAGNGALLNCCIERAGALDPAYTMTDVLADLSAAAVSPSFWEEWSESLREDPLLRVALDGSKPRR
jgi:hypothetical protein